MTAPSFDPSTFQAVVDEIQQAVEDIAAGITSFVNSVASALSNVVFDLLPALQSAIQWLADQIVNAAQAVRDWIVDVIKGVGAPLSFWKMHSQWHELIQGPSSEVAADTAPTALLAPRDWKGDAADAYTGAVAGQSPAAKSVQDIAGTVGTHLIICAGGGLAFYAGVVAIAATLIGELAGAEVAVDTVALAPAGLAGALASVVKNAGLLGGLGVVMAAFVGTQALFLGNVGNAENNRQAFPNGAWPVGTA